LGRACPLLDGNLRQQPMTTNALKLFTATSPWELHTAPRGSRIKT
jgi:hypothetical protein